jgi:hypothetical protein
MFITLFKYQLKMDEGPQYQTWTLKSIQERAGNRLEVIGIGK